MVCTLLVVLGGRLVQIQGLQAPDLAKQALETRFTERTLPAHRGDIVDAKGNKLAWTVDRVNIKADQRLMPAFRGTGDKENPEGIKGVARLLAPVLGMDPAALTKALTGDAAGAYVKKDVTPEVYRKVRELRIPGIGAEPASRRVYPNGPYGAQVVGFLTKDGRAMGGVERLFDDQLKGTDGFRSYERATDGTPIPTGVNEETPPVDGVSVRLTLDRDIQYAAQQALDAGRAAADAESAYVVVMTKTGQLLALASSPGFDASNPGASKAEDRENRALTDIFEPGSTSKVITLAAALEEGAVTPETRMTVPGTLKRSDRTFHDSHSHGPEKLTVAGVLAKSSNIGTIMAGEKLSPQTMYDYMRKFGLGQRTGVVQSGDKRLLESAGLLADPSKWSGSQRYTVLFGQGLAVTALQSADVFATIANDGVRVTPRLVAGTTSADGVWTPAPAAPSTRVVSADTARKMRLMMESVVGEEGTAVKAEIPGYRVAGKTGTSQLADPSCGCYRAGWYTSSFIGMAPADDPELVVAVVMQKPKNGYYGGTVAAPVFQQVMSAALIQRQVPPTGTKAPKVALEWK